MKVRDMLKLLAADGWVLKSQEGSHRQFVHPTKRAKITVPGHPSGELRRGTEKNIRKYAGLKE
ncbi:MAG: type II toxin-antitoxin system HicA family toxin [Vicinamibacteraceae bacterium]